MKRLVSMKQLLTITLTLSVLLSLALWSAGRGVFAQAATYPLNPNSFASLGAFPTLAPGVYYIIASKDNANPVLTQSDAVTVISTGIFYDPTPANTTNKDEIAVFTYDNINVVTGVNIYGIQTTNTRPVAFLSKNSIVIDGVVSVSGGDAGGSTGGGAGPGGGGGGGGGNKTVFGTGGGGLVPGADGNTVPQGGAGGSIVAGGGGASGGIYTDGGGGAFGGNGGTGNPSPGIGGTAYGDLTVSLQGGSGGAGGSGSPTAGAGSGGGGGGGGAGAIEIGAVNGITIAGEIWAIGGRGVRGLGQGGSGAGGGILVYANSIALECDSVLNAQGGTSISSSSGGGGGGRVHLQATTITSVAGAGNQVNVNGGGGGTGGAAGVFTTVGALTIFPSQKLAFGQQPTATGPDTIIAPAVTVRIEDHCGNLITNSTATVTLTLGDNPSGATLTGNSVNAVGSIATFNNLKVSKAGSGYSLLASSSGLSSVTSNAFNITCQTITVTPAAGALPAGTTGSTYSQQFTQTGGTGTIIWSINPPVPGLSINASGLLSGTPTQAKNYTFEVTATDGNGCPGSTSYSLQINCPTIDLTPTTLPQGAYNSPYPVTILMPIGGTSPYQFTVTGLPTGMSFNATTTNVTIGGTPTQRGSFTVLVNVTDAYSCGNGSNGRSYVLIINKANPVITWNNPANITYGTALSAAQLNATANVAGGFSYTPAVGTVLNVGNGQTLSVNFTPTDTANFNPTSKSVPLNVLQSPLNVTVNNAFRNQGEANPPFSGSITGLKNGDNITVSYSTTATINSAPGTYPITATLNDPGNRLSNYQVTNNPGTLTILNSCGIVISPTTFLQPSLALPYAQLLSASPAGTYTFSLYAGSLPPGLQIVNNYGYYTLQGTPTVPGTFTFTVRAQRSSSTCEAIRTYTVTIAPTVVPKVTCKTANANGSYTVWFGYENTTGAVVTIPVGANNTFTSGAADRGQTTVFQPGTVNNAFSVTFANAGAFTGWSLKGPDGALRGVVPSVLSPNCP